MFIGERIRECREKLNMSQEELANKLGYVARSSITRIEKGQNEVPLSKVPEFAKVLNTTTQYLLDIDASENSVLMHTSTDEESIYRTAGERIKLKRKELKLTQDELATYLGYSSRSSINKIEIGKSDIPFQKLKKLAEILHTTPEYLLGLDEEVYDPCIIEIMRVSKNLNSEQCKHLLDYAKFMYPEAFE